MNTLPEPRYSLTELADLASVTPRTVRYYNTQGLLPARDPGPGAKYDDADLARLRLIKGLQAEHQPLAEIRARLHDIPDAEIVRIDAGRSQAPATDSALDYIRRISAPRMAAEAPALFVTTADATIAPTPPAPVPDVRLERSQWERIDLAPDVQLHIRRPLVRSTAKRVDRLISIARDLLEEDPS